MTTEVEWMLGTQSTSRPRKCPETRFCLSVSFPPVNTFSANNERILATDLPLFISVPTQTIKHDGPPPWDPIDAAG